MDKKTIFAIIIYVVIAGIIIIVKPSIIYDEEKDEFKKFGFGDEKSLLTIETVLIGLAIFLGICVCLLSNDKNKKDNIKGRNNDDIEKELNFYKNLVKSYVSNS